MTALRLDDLREQLIRQEETIIFALIERAQFKRNLPIYEPGAFRLPGFAGCFSDWMLRETECAHAKVRRYTSPDEHPYFDELPAPILPPMAYTQTIRPNRINLNKLIREIYRERMLPLICEPGDCGNYGSSAVCDVACLQALSKRIHYGKFVAEAKFQAEPGRYTELIRGGSGGSKAILDALTNAAVEEKLLRRVELKGATYGQDVDVDRAARRFKIPPDVIKVIYRDWIVPLTKEVEVLYLLERLDPEAPAAGAGPGR